MGDVTLLPCPNPWCGGTRAIRKLLWPEHSFDVACSCGIESPACETKALARAAWNNRPAPALTPAQQAAEEMVEALEAVRDYDFMTSGVWLAAKAREDAAFAAIEACPECVAWKERNHPVQKGVCNDHWREIYAVEAMQKNARSHRAYAMRDIAIAALAKAGKP